MGEILYCKVEHEAPNTMGNDRDFIVGFVTVIKILKILKPGCLNYLELSYLRCSICSSLSILTILSLGISGTPTALIMPLFG
jgi:hypothetical protein